MSDAASWTGDNGSAVGGAFHDIYSSATGGQTNAQQAAQETIQCAKKDAHQDRAQLCKERQGMDFSNADPASMRIDEPEGPFDVYAQTGQHARELTVRDAAHWGYTGLFMQVNGLVAAFFANRLRRGELVRYPQRDDQANLARGSREEALKGECRAHRI